MNKEESKTMLELRVASKGDMDAQINAAVEQMIQVALTHDLTQGISVTRLGQNQFLVRHDETVPYGYTEERDCDKKQLPAQEQQAKHHSALYIGQNGIW
jgi:hypothetical protein